MNIGTLYDMNKLAMQKEKPLSNEELLSKIDEIKNFCMFSNNQYYMLLNKERSDFTLFNLKDNKVEVVIGDGLKECLQNRGKILSIEKEENSSAYEIWILIDNEPFVYYFFPYDEGVID